MFRVDDDLATRADSYYRGYDGAISADATNKGILLS